LLKETDIEGERTASAAERAKRFLAVSACDSAAEVLSHFEMRHRDDDRPRKAIEAGRAWLRGEISVGMARDAAFAAHAAARASNDPAAIAAARSAGHAAATAHVAGHAHHAAAYAIKAAAAAEKPE